jgi:hypothetical protein
MILEYNENNLQMVSDIIKDNLTSDLLPKKWVERNSTNITFGHCHNASGCLQKVFGTKNIKLYRAIDDEGIYHWWAVDLNGKLIDLTSEQYTSTSRVPPYKDGTKASILGFEYRKRVNRLLEKVTNELLSNGTPLL